MVQAISQWILQSSGRFRGKFDRESSREESHKIRVVLNICTCISPGDRENAKTTETYLFSSFHACFFTFEKSRLRHSPLSLAWSYCIRVLQIFRFIRATGIYSNRAQYFKSMKIIKSCKVTPQIWVQFCWRSDWKLILWWNRSAWSVDFFAFESRLFITFIMNFETTCTSSSRDTREIRDENYMQRQTTSIAKNQLSLSSIQFDERKPNGSLHLL